jgi:hypothetical protein
LKLDNIVKVQLEHRRADYAKLCIIHLMQS